MALVRRHRNDVNETGNPAIPTGAAGALDPVAAGTDP